MTTTYSAFDAKTHFSEILNMAGKGKEIVITKHGTPVAKLVPYEDHGTLDMKDAIEKMKNFAKGGRPLGMSIRKLRDMGRR